MKDVQKNLTKKIKIKKSLSYKGQLIDYFVTYKDQKYIRLKIDNNKIYVSSPVFANDWEIEQLIYKNINKIFKIIEYNEKNKFYEISDNGFIKINNQVLSAHFSKEILNKEKLSFKIYDSLDETLKKMYKKLAILYKDYFICLVEKHKKIMNLDFKNLSIKLMKGKWGVCYPEKSKIILNTKLLHFPQIALEYVIIHELSHLVHKNHSKDFWRFVERYMPDYKKVSELLKVNVL